MKKIALFIILFVLSGCATMHQSSFYRKTQLGSNKFELIFKGRGLAKDQKSSAFRLNRSAEVALEEGFSYFSIINYDIKFSSFNGYDTIFYDDSSINLDSRGNRVGSGAGEGIPTDTYSPKYTATYTILCYEEKPENTLFFDAQSVVREIKKLYGDQLNL